MQQMLLQPGLLQPLRAPQQAVRLARPCARPLRTQAVGTNGAASNGATATYEPLVYDGSQGLLLAEPVPVSDEVAAEMAAQGITSLEDSGLLYLSNEARMRTLVGKATKVEKIKNEKAGHKMWSEITELSELIRKGETKWEDLSLDDIDVRLKWCGLFHRRKRAPGTFMMRLKVPNGELTSTQLRFLASCIEPLGDKGCLDITTRANVQLRGLTLDMAADIMAGLVKHGMSSVQTGMDNVRNMTGSPIAGIDPHELLDVRPLNKAIDNMITNFGNGNPELANLPRKLNIGISPSRDDFPHTHINDVGLKAVKDPATGEVGFNVELGGYFSVKRNTMSIDGDTFLAQDQVVAYCKALLEVFRDNGKREDRQKSRLMWLVEEWGAEKFREMVAAQMGGATLRKAVHEKYDDVWQRRDVLGVHEQKQPGLFWVGACVPAGRLFAPDFLAFADVAEKYGDGTVRLTVEENILIPNVPAANLDALKAEPIFQKYKIDAGNLTRAMVSCVGAQFCGVAVIETKQRAMAIVKKLEEQLDVPKPVRIHWTGCPNSCGQVQVADIGLMGGPAKFNGKAVEGVRIFLGGTIGEDPALATEFEKGVACEESVLLPKLRDLLVERFGATVKEGALAAA